MVVGGLGDGEVETEIHVLAVALVARRVKQQFESRLHFAK